MLSLALDARCVYSRQRRGIGKMLVDLYRHVTQLEPDWQIVAFHRGRGTDDPFADMPGITPRLVDIPGDRLDLWRRVALPLAARRAGADLLHCPANHSPTRCAVPVVLTVHDLIPMDQDAAGSRQWTQIVRRSITRAEQIFTPSRYTKGRLIRAFQTPPGKICVTPWAPTAGMKPVTDADALARAGRAVGLDNRPYVLSFAAEDPRKNTDRLIDAWAHLPPSLRDQWQLLLIGAQARLLPSLEARIAERQLAGNVSAIGYVPDQDLPALLSGAELLCYPSLAEGFGVPVLDAFACGTAVLTSSTTSLPEVADDAADLVDPADTSAIAHALKQLLQDPARRDDLTRRGHRRVQEFTWERTARQFCDSLNLTHQQCRRRNA